MSPQTMAYGGRVGHGRTAQFRLDLAEWTVLRAALLTRSPEAQVPAGFDPESFGLDPERPLTDPERQRAWAGLKVRGLATHVPSEDDFTALTPGCLLGLLALLDSEVRVDLSSWSGSTVVNQAVAWSGGRTTSLARRQRQVRGEDGTAVLEPETEVEVSLSAAGGLLNEIMRVLPGRATVEEVTDRSPVRVGWPQSAAIARALRSARQDVATHLSGLPEEALSVVASSTALSGGACVTALRHQTEAYAFHGVWLWTDADVVELVDASPHAVTLRRTGLADVRSGLLSALTGLLHAEEVL